ncbi:MAG: hypothetical protein JKY94_17610 [Rhodobacteraceae bacterium]|nr:hypothetical protein [Paracoccaceae bacterium]
MHHKDQRAFLFRRLVDPKQLEGFEAQGVRPFVVALDGSLAPVMQQAVKDTHAMVWTGEDFGKVCPLFTGAVSRWEEIYGAKSKRVGVY